MTIMIAEVYDALVEAGASEEKARKAAEAIAGYEDRFGRIDVSLARIEGSQKYQQWQISLMLALQLLVIGKLFFFKG